MKTIFFGILVFASAPAFAETYFNCSADEYSLTGHFTDRDVDFTMWRDGNEMMTGQMELLLRAHNPHFDSVDLLVGAESLRNMVFIRIPEAKEFILGPMIGEGEVKVSGPTGRFYASKAVCIVTTYP